MVSNYPEEEYGEGFDPSEVRWVQVTTMGDNYDVEMSADGRFFRHRRFSLQASGKIMVGASAGGVRAWRYGRPPSGYWSTQQQMQRDASQ